MQRCKTSSEFRLQQVGVKERILG
ncbi:unnamed protein product [Victoria cruziana]